MATPASRDLDALIEEATVDCYDEAEQVAEFFACLEDELELPFTTRLFSVDVSVEQIEQTEHYDIPAPGSIMTPETSLSTAADWEVLSDFLLSDRVPNTCMHPAEVDGYLTGIAVSPDMIPPSDWLPVIWGGDEPEFAGIEEAGKV